jgi:hypothetical protein
VEIYESARRHGIGDEDIRQGVEHALVVADEEERAGFSTSARIGLGTCSRSCRCSETTILRS